MGARGGRAAAFGAAGGRYLTRLGEALSSGKGFVGWVRALSEVLPAETERLSRTHAFTVGYDTARSQLDQNPFPFRKGLSDMGYVEGRNVIFEDRVADQVDRLPALAAELVERRVTVILARTLTAAAAAKRAT